MKKHAGIDPAIQALRQKAPSNVLDYGFVMDVLKNYQAPRVKLGKLLQSGALIRLKKGLYVFGEPFVQGGHCYETLANLMYGPSYVSMEWALQLYGLIPERVEEVTSITYKRKKEIRNELGIFSYAHLPQKAFSVGITQKEQDRYQKAFVATPEKALTDLLVIRRGRVSSLIELKQILFDDLRLNQEDLKLFSLERLREIHLAHPHSIINFLIKVIGELKK